MPHIKAKKKRVKKSHEKYWHLKNIITFMRRGKNFFHSFFSLFFPVRLKLWKRKQSMVVWEWDLHNVENDEEPRPEFETSVKTFRINPVTREKEAFMPYW